LSSTSFADSQPAEVGPPDANAFLDPVDIVKLFPGSFLDVIGSPKWKDKNDLLEECLRILESPVNAKLIDNPDLRAYADALGKRMTDTNVNVVANAAKVIQGLATGMTDQGFGKYRGLVMLPMLERLKEKKKNVTEAIGNALDAVFKSVSLSVAVFETLPLTSTSLPPQVLFDDIVEDCTTACGNKNPQVREGTLSFVVRCLTNTKQAPRKQDFQTLADLQVSALGDADATIRSAAADGLGCFMKIFGERALNPYLEKANDLQKTKVRESFEKAVVQCKPGGAAPPPKEALVPSSAAINRPPPPKAGPPKVAGKPLSSAPLKPTRGGFGDDEHPPTPKATPRPIARPVVSLNLSSRCA
jgi:cytoskeleton-associated protein 5